MSGTDGDDGTLRIVVSGGPGAGKTTLLEALRVRGHRVADESARAIIRERRVAGLSPRPAPAEFARAILERDLDQYRRGEGGGVVFHDRGAVEAIGMLVEASAIDAAGRDALLARWRYHPQVLVLPPWQAIYTSDAERDQTFDNAVRVHATVCAWYRRCGYEVVELPIGSVDDRCDFVERWLAQRVPNATSSAVAVPLRRPG